MAFAFVVEDGSIVAGANSYVAVQEADDYLIQNPFVSPAWLALTTAQKQYYLTWATRYLDHRAVWNGETTTASNYNQSGSSLVQTWATPVSDTPQAQQPLRWPRVGVYDYDERLIPSSEIPVQLKAATIEMARYLLAQDRSVERPQDGLLEMRAGDVMLKFKPDYTLPIVPTDISFIIRGLGTIASGRTNFSKITRA